MSNPITLYWDTLSGHSHRVQLFLSLLRVPFTIQQVELRKGAHKTPEFRAINPAGQLPAIDDSGTVVTDSNAILTYLALTYDAARIWFPADPVAAAQVVRWFSFAAGPVAFGPARARLHYVFGANIDLEAAQNLANAQLPNLEAALTGKRFLVGDAPTVADVAVYTYVAHAPEGGISLEPFPAVRAWIARVEALPGFVPMQKTAVALAA